jgi:DNA-binding MarR family transcriptional regulator
MTSAVLSFEPSSSPRQHQLAADVRSTLAAIRAEYEGRPDPRWLDQVLKARKLRCRVIGTGLFADPAWDMLLELYAAEIGQRKISVSSLCIASGCPPTTAMRHIERLCSEGLISKENDPLDGRRKFVRFTPEGMRRLDWYMASIPGRVQSL